MEGFKDISSGFEFQQLEDDLKNMKAAGERLRKEERFKELGRQIREVVYDVEDAVDSCFTAAAAAKRKSILLRKLRWSNHNLAVELKSIRKDKVEPVLQKIKAAFAVLGEAAAAETEQPPQRPKRDLSTRTIIKEVLGFKDEEEKLLGLLLKEEKELDVISIIGMGGLGKTTLAQKVFENKEIYNHFPVRIWVYVSQDFNRRDVFLHILRNFTSNDMFGLSNEELAQSVRACLAKEKFLLVMDDVWSPEVWTVMQNVLTSGNGQSKVMIISRNRDVGVCAKVITDPHMMRIRSLEESWELLQLRVFGSERECPDYLKGIGEKLAHQCNGLPLAVVAVGGLLADLFIKTDGIHLKKEWENVSERLSNISIPEYHVIATIVELSYNMLPYYLRECFLYMAVFPVGHVISAWMLIRLWIAEGFIWPEMEITLEEVAKEYLGDLVSRNLLMLDQINSMGEIKTYRVHVLIHEFCIRKAMDQNIMANGDRAFYRSLSEVQHFRRLSFRSDPTKFLSTRPRLRGPCTRSFLCFCERPVNLEPRYISTIPNAFPLLRVLESISIKFNQFPAKVIKLIHLRYLTLHIEYLSILPEALSQLWNLQTLVVVSNSRSITMKANIWKMYRLRHLRMKAAIVLDPKWDGEGGENLQTLSRLAPESCTRKLSERACNLKELGVRGNLATLFSSMSMESLGCLEKLKLINDLAGESEILSGLPPPRCFPRNLKRLTLSNTLLGWTHISTLAKITTLEVLKLTDNAFVGIYWNAMDVWFPNLNLLLIVITDLVHWEVSPYSFPKLKSLVLKNCENLNEIPTGLAKSLVKLDIAGLGKSAVDSALRIEEGKKRAHEVGEKAKLLFRFDLSIRDGR